MNNSNANPINVIECTNLSKTYNDGSLHVEVLNNVSLQVERGEMMAIIGPSGSGKSTLLHLLGGLDTATTGSVKICGDNLNSLNEKNKSLLRNRHLGFIYQFHHLLPEFSALENVAIPLLIRGESSKMAEEKSQDILVKVGLQKRLQHRVTELSGGERQRVAIARALVTTPDCVLADEPTGNLDQKTAQHIHDLISELNQELHVAFVIVTHDLSWTNQINRTLRLEDGQLI